MGYNLAIEYLADYEKTWMLDSFRSLNESVLKPQRRPLKEWIFLEVLFLTFSFHCQKKGLQPQEASHKAIIMYKQYYQEGKGDLLLQTLISCMLVEAFLYAKIKWYQ